MATYSVSPAKGLKNILDTASVVTSPWVTTVGGFAPQPDKQVVLRNTGGITSFPSIAIDFPSVQVLIRGGQGSAGDYEEGYNMAVACHAALVGIPTGGADYPELTAVNPIGYIQELGRDDKNRMQWSFNLSLIVSYDSQGYRD